MTTQHVQGQHLLKVRVKEFGIPPIRDGLALGRNSPIGCAAIRKAIDLLVTSPFEHIEVRDEIVSDLLVRSTILRRIPQEKLVDFVLQRIKPLMGPEEILHLDLEAEVTLEDENL